MQWSYAADTFAHLLDMIQSQDFSLLSEVTDTEHENKVLSGAALKNGKILRNDSTVFLSLQQKSNEAPTLLWQMGITVGEKGVQNANRDLSVVLTENQQGIWVVTDVQIR